MWEYMRTMRPKIKLNIILIAMLVFIGGLSGTSCAVVGDGEYVSDQKPDNAIQLDNGFRFDQNGWIYIHIEGEPYERGYQHGYLVAPELGEILQSLKYLTYWNTGKTWEFFVEAAQEQFLSFVDPEYLDEMKGIADGAKAAGVEITWQEVLAWNGYDELTGYWWPTVMGQDAGDDDHCSAFIATGSVTKDGGVVMAHNSWDDFEIGQFFNVVLDIEPSNGHRIFMQSVPGYIDSMTDFFVTGAGLIGTETTIGGYSGYEPNEVPEFVRVRRAMQYADTLDAFVDIMKKQNNGGYANSWLLADVETGEIMLFELGLKYQNVERKKDGYFIGFNAPFDPRIRNLECSDTGFTDIRMPAGARHVRFTELMQKYHGKVDVTVAKTIIADHHDVYLNKDNPCSRTIDGHYELDPFQYYQGRQPFQPKGAVDGKVTDSALAKTFGFWGRWGNSSGIPFDADKFLEEHIQWGHLKGYLKDRPSQPWTLFQAGKK